MDGNVNESIGNFEGQGPPPYQPPPDQPYQQDPYGPPPQYPPQQPYQQPYGPPPGPPMGPPMPPAQTAKPVIAGIMLIVFGLINIGYAIYTVVTVEEATSQFEGIGGDMVGFLADIVMICSIIVIIFSVISILGGYFATQRTKFGMAIVGAIVGLFTFGPYCLSSLVALIALILIAISRDEFI